MHNSPPPPIPTPAPRPRDPQHPPPAQGVTAALPPPNLDTSGSDPPHFIPHFPPWGGALMQRITVQACKELWRKHARSHGAHVQRTDTCARSHGARVQGAMVHVCKEPWCTRAKCCIAHMQEGTMVHVSKQPWCTHARTHGAHVQGTAVHACKEPWCTRARSHVCVHSPAPCRPAAAGWPLSPPATCPQ